MWGNSGKIDLSFKPHLGEKNLAAKRSAGVTPEVNHQGMCNTYIYLCQVWIRLPTLALKPRGNVTRGISGISGPTKKAYVLQKFHRIQQIFLTGKLHQFPTQIVSQIFPSSKRTRLFWNKLRRSPEGSYHYSPSHNSLVIDVYSFTKLFKLSTNYWPSSWSSPSWQNTSKYMCTWSRHTCCINMTYFIDIRIYNSTAKIKPMKKDQAAYVLYNTKLDCNFNKTSLSKINW